MDRRLTRLFVRGLRSRSGSKESESIFSEHGKIKNFDIKDGTGFVEYEKSEEASKAIKALEGIKFGGEKIHVEYAMKSTNQFMKKKKEILESDRESGRCFKCKQKGHIAKNCPKSRGRSDSRSRSRSRSKSRSRSRSHSKSNHKNKSNHHHNHSKKKKSKHSHKSRSRSHSKSRSRSKSPPSRKTKENNK